MARTLLLSLLTVALALAFVLVSAEVGLRFLPVGTGLNTQPVNEDQPVAHYEPDRCFVWSRGWNFEMVNRGCTNNEGFVNDQDYTAEDPRPLFAIVGDSLIDALMVPYAQTVQGRLQRAIQPHGRVYTFAMSGAPMSQYVALAEYAGAKFAPDALAINIIGNDFDESLAGYAYKPGFHQFAPNGDGELVLRRNDYEPSLLRRTLSSSALVRYLYFTMNVSAVVANLRQALQHDPPEYVGNTDAAASPQRLTDSKRVVDQTLDELPGRSGLPPERIMFVVGALFEAIYEPDIWPKADRSYFGKMRRYLIEQAKAKGYAVLDLHPFFANHYRQVGDRFDYRIDGHWNPIAHGIVADAILSTPMFSEIFSRAASPGAGITPTPRASTTVVSWPARPRNSRSSAPALRRRRVAPELMP